MIQILEHAFSLLETLVNTGRPTNRADVESLLGVSEPDAERILASLAHQGYLQHDATTDSYVLGSRCFELASMARGTRDLRAAALTHLAELGERVGETVHLGIYHAGDVVYVAQIERSTAIDGRMPNIGVRAPGFSVSVGRVLLAHQHDHELERALTTQRLPHYTTQTVTDPGQLRHELERTRKRGYAVNRGSWREAVGGIAAPVRDHSGAVVAGIGCCAPIDRLDDRPDGPQVTAVLSAAQEVSTALGYGLATTRSLG